jgi:transcriptional regulator with GAF, ATPase, and Fis domain
MMERFTPLLFEVWREVGRHIEIEDAVSRIARMLGRRLPLELLLIEWIESQRRCVETVAAANSGGVSLPGPPKLERTSAAMEELLAWCSRRKVARGSAAGGDDERRLLRPAGDARDFLVGPLSVEGAPAGLLVLLAEQHEAFTRDHQAIVRVLLDPLSAVLENHRRLRDIREHWEAAEADKRAALSRLGRQTLRDAIIGADLGLRSVMERVELVARSDVPVLILGETGSGKEVIARAIHDHSPRAAGPFLRVNCGAISPELIDSELFGHERGSFTGAVAARKGWFERADGGTLLLDEIGELPVAAQVRLLRILQDGSFERVGGERQLHTDVRVVAATNRDLQAMVGDGRFREDLWYRIAVFPIPLPALRERVEDIPALALHFAVRASRRFGTRPFAPSPDDLKQLASYPWPGNVRELAAVIDRAAILGNGKRLEVATALGIPTPPPTSRVAPAVAAAGEPQNAASGLPTLDAAMTSHIEAALARTAGRIEGPFGAARLLAINPHTLRARMRKLGIDGRRFRRASPDAR